MSGKPNRYPSDPAMYRDQYMEALELRSNIDDMNLQANKTYKATGQLPPVSQMPETRTTSEILADNERLKIDLVKILAPVADSQLALAIIQRIQNSPFNTSGSLFTFFAQRAPEIVTQLKKSYSLKIKGDQNDIETFVSFIEEMFTKTKAITSTVSDFFKNSSKTEYNILDAKDFNKIYLFFDNIIAKLSTIAKPSSEIGKRCNRIAKSLSTYSKFVSYKEMFDNVKQIVTLDPEKFSMMESGKRTNMLDNFYDINTRYMEILKTFPSENRLYTLLEQLDNASKNKQTDLVSNILLSIEGLVSMTDEITALNEDINEFKIQINTIDISQPLGNLDTMTIEQLQILRKDITDKINRIDNDLNNKNINKETKIKYKGNKKILLSNIEIIDDTINKKLDEQENNDDGVGQPQITTDQIPTNQLPEIDLPPSLPSNQHDTGGGEGEPRVIPKDDDNRKNILKIEIKNLEEKIEYHENVIKNAKVDIANATPPNYDLQKINKIKTSGKIIKSATNEIKDASIKLEKLKKELHDITGQGIMKRRGRPRGCGIVKQKPYSESVKAHVSYDKGIMESPRFVKFGKYLINNHKLNNDDIFALKQPSGGALQEFPSVRLSKQLSNVIKKMVGGGVPSYNDLNGLSEPEKAYLHKVSTRSNIVDKFSIPAPSKDQYEKDIHEFEVLKGEIMAGNDSKELIKKFKLHLMKLSKMGSLPKREVSEVMEELIQMGY